MAFTPILTVMTLSQIFCLCFSIYFYLIHEDLEKSIIEPIDLTTQLSDYQPWEMYMQIFLTFLSFFSGHWFWFTLQVPLALIHLKMLLRKEHLVHCFTYREYTQGNKKEKNERWFLCKSIYYGIILALMIAMGIYSAAGAILKYGNLMPLPKHPYLSNY